MGYACRDSGNDHFLKSYWITELLCNYLNRNKNFISCFLDTILKSYLFLVYHFYVAPSCFKWLGTLRNKNKWLIHPKVYACICKLSGAFAWPAQPVHTFMSPVSPISRMLTISFRPWHSNHVSLPLGLVRDIHVLGINTPNFHLNSVIMHGRLKKSCASP